MAVQIISRYLLSEDMDSDNDPPLLNAESYHFITADAVVILLHYLPTIHLTIPVRVLKSGLPTKYSFK